MLWWIQISRRLLEFILALIKAEKLDPKIVSYFVNVLMLTQTKNKIVNGDGNERGKKEIEIRRSK